MPRNHLASNVLSVPMRFNPHPTVTPGATANVCLVRKVVYSQTLPGPPHNHAHFPSDKMVVIATEVSATQETWREPHG